jgi:voltage-gated potassium channel
LTVGYGDIVATTAIGQVISVLLGLIGLVFTGLVVAMAVRALGQAWADTHDSGS